MSCDRLHIGYLADPCEVRKIVSREELEEFSGPVVLDLKGQDRLLSSITPWLDGYGDSVSLVVDEPVPSTILSRFHAIIKQETVPPYVRRDAQSLRVQKLKGSASRRLRALFGLEAVFDPEQESEEEYE